MDIVKDPQAVELITVDWELDTDETIATVTWSITGIDDALALGAEAQAPTNDETSATCWLLGGTLGGDYEVTCRVTTSAGRTPNDHTVVVGVRST